MPLLELLDQAVATKSGRPDEAAIRATQRASNLETTAQWGALKAALGVAQDLAETQARLVGGLVNDSDPRTLATLARLGEDGVDKAKRLLGQLRFRWGKCEQALEDFGQAHKSIEVLESELKELDKADRQDKLVQLKHQALEKSFTEMLPLLELAAERQTGIEKILSEMEELAPGSTARFPRIPVGILITGGGLRSIPNWYAEMLATCDPERFPADHGARKKVEAARAAGQQVVIWNPSSPSWD